jgi:hypothetical protein
MISLQVTVRVGGSFDRAVAVVIAATAITAAIKTPIRIDVTPSRIRLAEGSGSRGDGVPCWSVPLTNSGLTGRLLSRR